MALEFVMAIESEPTGEDELQICSDHGSTSREKVPYTPKLRSRSVLPNVIYVAPSQDEIKDRTERLNKEHEDRCWCSSFS